MRISGITIPDSKRVDIALTYIFGVGRSNVLPILKAAAIDKEKKAGSLSEAEINTIQKVLETYKIEGDLRGEIISNVKRLKEVGTYRGLRHARNLPAHGQRTRSNARTKRGKRMTIGAIKKELATKMGADSKPAAAPAAKK
jgi:small subunit ribosomal protein S13